MMPGNSVRRQRAAFTLIEILIVVVILGILAAIVIPQFAESADAAKTSAADSTLKVVRSQVELYKFNNSGLIPTLQDLEDGGFLTKFNQPEGYCIAIDPTGGEVTMTAGVCAE